MWPNLQEIADLVTFTEKTLKGKLYILCSETTFFQIALEILLNKYMLYEPTNKYMLKVNNRNNRKKCEICSNLTVKTQERHPVFLFLTLSIFHAFF